MFVALLIFTVITNNFFSSDSTGLTYLTYSTGESVGGTGHSEKQVLPTLNSS